MGTNYYLKDKGPVRIFDPVHIGKSSGGWCFSLQVYPDKGIVSLEDWKYIFDTKVNDLAVIEDEYGEEYTVEQMLNIITNRFWPRKPFVPNQWYKSEAEFLERNHAEYGPNGLLRHWIDGEHCVGHGEGTWDYIAGEFW